MTGFLQDSLKAGKNKLLRIEDCPQDKDCLLYKRTM